MTSDLHSEGRHDDGGRRLGRHLVEGNTMTCVGA
jgi:hypothetical protein